MINAEAIVVDVIVAAAAVFATYLTVVLVVGITLRLVGAHPLAAALDAVTPRVVRRIVAALMSVQLTAPIAAAAAQRGSDAPVTMHRLPDTDSPPTTTSTTTTSTTTTSIADRPPGESPPLEADDRPLDGTADLAPTTWTVAPGEHFWAIAERLLAQAWGREATPAETVGFWLQLIERNRSRLVDPGNADLIFPGQELVLPPVPAVPG